MKNLNDKSTYDVKKSEKKYLEAPGIELNIDWPTLYHPSYTSIQLILFKCRSCTTKREISQLYTTAPKDTFRVAEWDGRFGYCRYVMSFSLCFEKLYEMKMMKFVITKVNLLLIYRCLQKSFKNGNSNVTATDRPNPFYFRPMIFFFTTILCLCEIY